MRASGDVPVPVAFGYHPYLRLPGVDRSAWLVEIPVRERVVLDSEELPNSGESEPADVASGPLGSRTFDDEFEAPAEPFALAGGGRRIEVSFEGGYPFAQVYAPDDDDVIAFEPMTAPDQRVGQRAGPEAARARRELRGLLLDQSFELMRRAPTDGDVGAEFRELFERVSNWGRWGADDERGALNYLTPERVAAAAHRCGLGETVSSAARSTPSGNRTTQRRPITT